MRVNVHNCKCLFVAIFLVSSILVACGSSGGSDVVFTPEPVPAEYDGLTNPLGPEAAAAGAEAFNSSCKSCHGPEGHGDGPASESLNPRPKNLAELHPLVGDDYLFWRIAEGKSGTSMISWRGILTDEQIWQLVAFIRTLK
jgi:mono/diheme cytochrome c family protein